jgi:hypothetical protein
VLRVKSAKSRPSLVPPPQRTLHSSRTGRIDRIRNSDSFDLKLPMEAPGKDIHRPAVSVVGRVADVLIVEADFRR